MSLAPTIDSYLESRTNANRSRGTIALYRRQLADWQSWRVTQNHTDDLRNVTSDALSQYFAHLRSRPHTRKANSTLSSASQSSAYRTIRAFWRWCMRHDATLPDVFASLDCPRVPRSPRKEAGAALLRKLLAACGDPQSNADGETIARNRAVLLLLYESGARIGELAQLTDDQVDLHKRRAHVIGKGEKHRPIFWGRGAGVALAEYMLLRRGKRGGTLPLFRGTSIRNRGGAMSADALRAALKRLALANDIDLPHGSPCHSFRHGFARRAIRAGADISDVSKLLGHSNLQTTMIYLEGDDEQLSDTYDRIFSRSANTHARHSDAESHG
jgi:site-specific recombinase XerD